MELGLLVWTPLHAYNLPTSNCVMPGTSWQWHMFWRPGYTQTTWLHLYTCTSMCLPTGMYSLVRYCIHFSWMLAILSQSKRGKLSQAIITKDDASIAQLQVNSGSAYISLIPMGHKCHGLRLMDYLQDYNYLSWSIEISSSRLSRTQNIEPGKSRIHSFMVICCVSSTLCHRNS